MIEIIPFGNPRSISYLLSVESLTLKVIEFSNINFKVAITECI